MTEWKSNFMSGREGKPLPYKYEFFAKGSRPLVVRFLENTPPPTEFLSAGA